MSTHIARLLAFAVVIASGGGESPRTCQHGRRARCRQGRARRPHPELETAPWQGVWGPANIPKAVVTRLSEAVKRGLERPEVRERHAKLGTPATYRAPAVFAELAKADVAGWLSIIKTTGATID